MPTEKILPTLLIVIDILAAIGSKFLRKERFPDK